MNTKVIKRFGSVILIIAMLLSLNIIGVLAGPDAAGRDPEKDVSLTIFKYKYDGKKEFPDSDGTKIEDEEMPQGAQPIPGVIFQIDKVTLKQGVEEPSNDPQDYEPIAGESEFSTIGTTDSDGKVVFSTIKGENTAEKLLSGQGIYKVTEVKNPTAATLTMPDFIVSLPMTNPATGEGADPWLYNVFAYPKNDIQGSIEKEIESNETLGNLITWKYSVNIPDDIKNPLSGKERLVITDSLDSRLLYVADSIKGTYTGKDNETEIELNNNEDYTIVVKENGSEDQKKNQVLEITMTSAGFKKMLLAKEAAGTNTPMLYFTFSTSTNITQTEDLEKIQNGGELEYTNSAGLVYEKENIEEENKPEKDVFGIEISKINMNGEALAGAYFNIYTSKEDAKNKTQPLKKPGSSDIWTVTTDKDGRAYFYGLVEGTYYLVESEAPKGYNLLSEPIEVKIINNEQNKEGTVSDTEKIVKITVTNNKGFVIPETGDRGTIMFTTAGLSLICIAVTLMLLAKRKRAKDHIKE